MLLKTSNNAHIKTCNYYIFFVIIVFIFFLSACFKYTQQGKIVVPKNNVLSSYDKYLIIQKPYTRIYNKKNMNSDVLYIARKGDIVEVEKSAGVDEGGFFWYQIVYVPHTDTVVTVEKNVEKKLDKTVRGWVLLLSPMRTNSKEKANFISDTLLKRDTK